jgi:3-oxoadipate enol-lactonase
MPTVETNGIQTYYEDYGDGQPVVVLHGAFADHQVWTEQLQPLTDDYRVLLYDLRGHGKTGGSALNQYTVDTYVDDLAAFINALALDRAVVLGHSWGGMVGYAFADAYPEKLSSLVTVGARTSETFSTRERAFMAAHNRVVMPLMGNDRVVKAAMWAQQKFAGDDSTVDMDELQQLREAHECDTPELSAVERSKISDSVREYFESSWSWELPETSVLMLYGENEPFIEAHADYLETRLENCRTAEIPGAGHNAQVDNPEFVRNQTREFLDEAVAEQEAAVTSS